MLNEEGVVYSWGKNEGNILGRESKTDLRSLLSGLNDNQKRLGFSNFYPEPIVKL